MENESQLNQILSKDDATLYFVGIGGIAMSATANIAAVLGNKVSGSDSAAVYSPAKDVLDEHQIKYFTGYDARHILESSADLYILSAGENEQNPEVKEIIGKNLPRCGLAELLYEFSKNNLRMVIAGTHGKTTTTGLLGHLVKSLDDGSFMAGGVLQNYQSNFYKGNGHYFVLEGDEYREQFDDPTPKFQYYHPDILVLTNLEYDHPDQFASLDELEKEFSLLIEKMPEDGLIVYNADNAILARLVHQSNVASVGFGIDNETDFQAVDIDYAPDYTKIHIANKFSKDQIAALLGQTEDYQIQLPGKINVYNALAAIATLRVLGFTRENLVLDLLSYQGIKRRFEVVGVKNGITIVDDYAHHPTAVRETLDAARLKYPKSKLWAVFEPHTFSRTKATIDDLARSFDAADEVLISDIYPARESAKDASITSEEVVQAVKGQLSNVKGTTNVRLVHNKQQALSILKSELKPGDVVVIMAVGSFNRLAYELKKVL
jgi:UDP-N-acetylmuramate--L-alanine ligase